MNLTKNTLIILLPLFMTVVHGNTTPPSWGTADITLLTPGRQHTFTVPLDGNRIYPGMLPLQYLQVSSN